MRFSELNKVCAHDKTNEPYVGYVIGSRFKDGRWIYKISISEDPRATETWDMQRLELSLLAKLPSNQRKLITEGQPVVLEILVTEVAEQTHCPQGAKESANKI